jgi:hypothetical protein
VPAQDSATDAITYVPEIPAGYRRRAEVEYRRTYPAGRFVCSRPLDPGRCGEVGLTGRRWQRLWVDAIDGWTSWLVTVPPGRRAAAMVVRPRVGTSCS